MERLRRAMVSGTRCGLAVRRRWVASSSSAAPGGGEPAASRVSEAGAGGEADADEGGAEWPRRVVSGLQPTGTLHVGNYFGALRRCVRAQQAGDDLMLFVADLHALTTTNDAGALQERTLQTAALALAAGLDPERGVLFAQSAVPRHAELCWLLACLCTQARLHHLPHYREKAGALKEGAVGVGLMLYPVLQAADVLLYGATHVPVGADQRQHLQLAALLARTFYHRHGGRPFPVPRALLPSDGSDRVRSLRDPARKMSKSDRDPRAAILLTDSDDQIRHKVRKAVTDCNPRVTFEPETRPGVSNLVTLHALAEDKTPEEVVEENDQLTTHQYKAVVAEALVAAVGGVRARAAALGARPGELRAVLRAGAARARHRADATWEHVARLAGLAAPADETPLAVLRAPAKAA